MGQIRVHVGMPGETLAPNTGTLTQLPSTFNESGRNTYYVELGVFFMVILVILLPILFVKKWKQKAYSKKDLVFRIIGLAILSFGLSFSALFFSERITKNAIAENQSDQIVTAEDVDIYVELGEEPVYVSAASTITVKKSTENGCTLKAYSDFSNLVADENSNKSISGLSISGPTTLSENSWGFSLTRAESPDDLVWTTLPTTESDALVIKNTSDPTPENDPTVVYYGVYLSPNLEPGTYVGTVNYVVETERYLQDVASWGDSVNEGEEVFAIDRRDRKVYSVARLKDGNLWITQNLDFDIDSNMTYTSTDTDLPSGTVWTPSLSTYDTSTTDWDWTFTPISYDPGEKYWNGNLCSRTQAGDCESVTGDTHNHLGNYYNWTAAIAMNDSSHLTEEGMIVDQSICPAGWTLPRARFGKDSFYALVNEYDTWDSSTKTLINGTQLWASPTYLSLTGAWYGEEFGSSIGNYGLFWTAMTGYGWDAFNMYLNYSGRVEPGIYSSDRGDGYPVRCIARPVTSIVVFDEP